MLCALSLSLIGFVWTVSRGLHADLLSVAIQSTPLAQPGKVLLGTNVMNGGSVPIISVGYYLFDNGNPPVFKQKIATVASSVSNYAYAWDTTNITNGSYSIETGVDIAGQTIMSGPMPITINNPPLFLLSPTANATVTGKPQITVGFAPASNATKVQKVVYLRYNPDNSNKQIATVTSEKAPLFTYNWDTAGLTTGGVYALQAFAYDSTNKLVGLSPKTSVVIGSTSTPSSTASPS